MPLPPDDALYLNIRRAAAIAGVCPRTVRRWCFLSDDPVPAIRLSDSRQGKIRVLRAGYLAWLRRRQTVISSTKELADSIVREVTNR